MQFAMIGTHIIDIRLHLRYENILVVRNFNLWDKPKVDNDEELAAENAQRVSGIMYYSA